MTSAIAVAPGLATESLGRNESAASGVSWGAVAAGALGSASLSLILLSLGAGMGLSSVSPWSNAGATAAAVGTASIVWLIAMQIVSSSMGGYLAGRLRTKWVNIHDDEVYFRDTAHGFLAWSVGLVITASMLVSAGAAMVGSSSTSDGNASVDRQAYYVDSLYRTDKQMAFDEAGRGEAGRIVAKALSGKEIVSGDKAYLTQVVAARTGMSPADADLRVNNVLSDARQALDSARKATAHALLWMFISLLIGAFCASYSATVGGRQRDHIRVL